MKRCMYCGNENDDASQNCSKCGNPLLDTPPQQAVLVEEPEEMPAPEVMEEAAEEVQPSEAEPVMEEAVVDEMPIPEQEVVPEMDDMQQYGNPDMQQYGAAGYAQNMQYGGQGYNPAQQQYYDQGYNPEMQQQYGGQPYGNPEMQQQYGGQPYGNPDMQYGGQAYGYQQPVQQFGDPSMMGQGNAGMGFASGEQLMTKARKSVKSFLFFLVAVFFTAKLVGTIGNIVSGSMNLTLTMVQSNLQNVLGNSMVSGYVDAAMKAVNSVNSFSIPIALVAQIPTVLICLGLWMMFFATSAKKDEISTAGYTMVKVIYVLKFIAVCLVLVLSLVLSVAFVVAAGASGSVTSIVVGVIVLLVLIVVAVLVIMFYVQLLHMFKVVKCNCRNGLDVGGISSYVPVIGIILAILNGLAMLPMSPDDIFGLVSQGAGAAWMLFASIWVFVYRAKTAK